MEHGGNPDPGTEMSRIGSNRQHGLRGCLEQQVIHQDLVVEGDGGDLGRKREDYMEVADGQQIGFPGGQPGSCGCALALGAVPIAAAVIGDPPVPAVFTGFDVTAKGCGAAVLYRRHHLELAKAQMPGLGNPVRGSSSTEDVRHLE